MSGIEAPVLAPVIGIEVHAQLLTASKMFCGCSAAYAGAAPNSNTCTVCLGMPGSLPVINRRAVEYTIATALGLNCDVAEHSKFDRKNYSYPDLPKGYQITQYDRPIGLGGWLEYEVNGEMRRCGIVRVHLEEDTGKTLHTSLDGREVSLVDYNRSGVPLMEIVTEPDLRSPEAAREFFATLRRVLMYLGVNDGNLQEGSMRADLNVSLSAPDGTFGTKVEIKNLNSFRAVQRALEYEIERQRQVLSSGGALVQETRGWSEARGATISQRGKEFAHDYRYFPEPDLPPLVIPVSIVEAIRRVLPELPAERAGRFQGVHGLNASTALVLTNEKALADFYEQALAANPDLDPGLVANWATGELSRLVNESGAPIEESRLSPAAFAKLLGMIDSSLISGTAGKQVLEELFRAGGEPEELVARFDLAQINDETELERLVDAVLEGNRPVVDQYLGGKLNVIQALVGLTMKASGGKARPPAVRAILERKLGRPEAR
ncbi:MAG: Asp-tRNA(Asn)/Glu-tRNA(Gln) amidotransferase subunit GatB [Chloroflexota bacterium]|nr:Asp-tRNA(Asn)/Glu-tRNA(Gln) amidotransferase subunit GatB [Chloroflexota bacterium]